MPGFSPPPGALQLSTDNDLRQQQQQQKPHRTVRRAAPATARAVLLAAWLRLHAPALQRRPGRNAQCPDRFVLCGKWVVALHSIGYPRLPDRFLAFDLLDRGTGRWASRRMLTRAFDSSDILQVPLVAEYACR
jgi:hypothetical protein